MRRYSVISKVPVLSFVILSRSSSLRTSDQMVAIGYHLLLHAIAAADDEFVYNSLQFAAMHSVATL
jgi:hypothetical protein